VGSRLHGGVSPVPASRIPPQRRQKLLPPWRWFHPARVLPRTRSSQPARRCSTSERFSYESSWRRTIRVVGAERIFGLTGQYAMIQISEHGHVTQNAKAPQHPIWGRLLLSAGARLDKLGPFAPQGLKRLGNRTWPWHTTFGRPAGRDIPSKANRHPDCYRRFGQKRRHRAAGCFNMHLNGHDWIIGSGRDRNGLRPGTRKFHSCSTMARDHSRHGRRRAGTWSNVDGAPMPHAFRQGASAPRQGRSDRVFIDGRPVDPASWRSQKTSGGLARRLPLLVALALAAQGEGMASLTDGRLSGIFGREV